VESVETPSRSARRQDASTIIGNAAHLDDATAPNEEFGRAFMTKFFQPEDLPILMGSMGKE
ncbi:MAG: hypothetical protein LUF30_11205, partial [Lachnospiraceae bacterium]|nr:hypothetical protein [Lachnospiraceae bacterium]